MIVLMYKHVTIRERADFLETFFCCSIEFNEAVFICFHISLDHVDSVADVVDADSMKLRREIRSFAAACWFKHARILENFIRRRAKPGSD